MRLRTLALALFTIATLLLAGCSQLGPMAAIDIRGAADDTATAEMDDQAMDGDSESMAAEGDGATATIATRSLRVRQAPDENAEVVAGAKEGEVYNVLDVSEDGLWVELAIAAAPEGRGWVSASFVTVSGALEGSTGEALILEPTATPAEAAEAEPTAMPTEEAAEAEPTAMPAEEAAEAEPTAMPAEETAEAEPTAMPAEEATEAEPTAMPAEEAAEAEPTAMPAEEAPEAEPTAVPAEESGESEPAGPPAPPAAGFATVYTDGTRLRVRAEPTVESEIVGYVYNGETYQVIGQSEDGAWVNIAGSTETETDNPDGGWVSAEFLVIGQ